MKRTLLRLPSPKWDGDLATGVDLIDDYLQQVDAGLVGAQSVRRLTLLEARDFLIEAIEKAPPEQHQLAIKQAAKAFGKPDDIARRQRAERYKLFGELALSYGLIYATLMLVMAYLGNGLEQAGLVRIAGMFVFHAVFFGTFMGWWTTLGFAQAPTSGPDTDSQPDGFVVSYSRSSVVAAWLLAVGFGLMNLMVILGLAGIGWFGAETIPLNLMLLVIGLWLSSKSIACLMFKVQVANASFIIHSWRGKKQLSFSQVTGFTEMPGWYVIFTFEFGRVFRLQWQDEHGRGQSMILGLNSELENAERFQAALERALEGRRQSNDPESK